MGVLARKVSLVSNFLGPQGKRDLGMALSFISSHILRNALISPGVATICEFIFLGTSHGTFPIVTVDGLHLP